MHILFLTHYFPPEVNAPATRTHEHCRRWVQAGHRVTVITCAPNCPNGVVFDGYRNQWRSREIIDGIEVIRVWTYLAANQGFLRRIVNYLSYMVTATLGSLMVRKVDVVIATSPQFFCGWTGVLCRWLRRRPFVLEVRDIWPESILAVGAMRQSPIIRLLETCERRMYATADRIVTVGEGYKQKLIDRGVADEKISVIPNGVTLDDYRPSPEHCSNRADKAPQPFVCTYVGTVGLAHGRDVVLQAAETAVQRGRGDLHFRIVGDGAQRRRLEQETDRLGLTNVEFTGLVPKSEVPRLIAESDACLVHLRGTELFSTVIPSKIFEMMAMNVPIIMGVRGQSRDIVLAAGAGVAMPPDDAGSLLECIDEIRRRPEAYRNGRAYVGRHFDREKLAAELLAVLEATARSDGCPDEDRLTSDDSPARLPQTESDSLDSTTGANAA